MPNHGYLEPSRERVRPRRPRARSSGALGGILGHDLLAAFLNPISAQVEVVEGSTHIYSQVAWTSSLEAPLVNPCKHSRFVRVGLSR